MKKEIYIRIIGSHEELDGESNREVIENIYPATYIQKDGCHYLFYEESQEGFGEIKNNVVVNTDGSLQMSKKGVVNSDMEFRMGETGSCDYKTPISTVTIDYGTEYIETNIQEENISIRLSYTMALDKVPYSRSCVDIQSVDVNGNINRKVS